MIALRYSAAQAGADRVLLIMLPGAGITAARFAEHGMVAAAQATEIPVDVIAVEPNLELYLDGGIAGTLLREIIEPARRQGYACIWLLGISLGAMGALLTAAACENLITGVVLLAPFLGTKGTIAELDRAGGLTGWRGADSAATASEQTLLVWLQSFMARRPAAPALYLGYGEADRFAAGHRLLAKALPADRVAIAAGGHDWETWTALWRNLLAVSPFIRAAAELDDTVPGRIA